MLQSVRQSCIFLSNGEDDLIIFFLAESIKEGKKGRFDGLNGHEGGDNGDLMNGIDSAG
jgi:hypothetical protein